MTNFYTRLEHNNSINWVETQNISVSRHENTICECPSMQIDLWPNMQIGSRPVMQISLWLNMQIGPLCKMDRYAFYLDDIHVRLRAKSGELSTQWVNPQNWDI